MNSFSKQSIIASLSLMILVLALICLTNSEIRSYLGLDKSRWYMGLGRNSSSIIAESSRSNFEESIRKQLSEVTLEQEVFYDGIRPKVKIKIGKIDNIPEISNYKVALFVRPDDAYQIWDFQGSSLLSNKDIQIRVEIDKNLKIKCFLYQAIIYEKSIRFEKYPIRYEEDNLQSLAINSSVIQSCFN